MPFVNKSLKNTDPNDWKKLSILINSSSVLLQKSLSSYPSEKSKRLYCLWKDNNSKILTLSKKLNAEHKIVHPAPELISKLENQ